MQRCSARALQRSGVTPLLLALAMALSVFVAVPVSAHPVEDCAPTDAPGDEDCEEDTKGSETGGDPVYLDDSDAVLERDGVFDTSKNLKALGFSENAVPLSGDGAGVYNSDLAFWENYAIQGTYNGFRIVDIEAPENPTEIVNYQDCVAPGDASGSQGDIVVYGDILVRSWDAPRNVDLYCGEVLTPAGQEGVHVFDISDPTNPVALTFVSTPCGSHTASGIPDLANGRLLIYSSPSSGAAPCRGIDLIEVPLADPAGAEYLRFVRSGQPSGPLLTIDEPSSAAGTYVVANATFGPEPTEAGVSGAVVSAVSAPSAAFPTAAPTEGCGAFVDFQAGAIAVVDRGTCPFTVKVKNAQDAGAVAVIVANSVAGFPTTMGGADPTITIPSVMVSRDDGAAIRAGLPATGTVGAYPTPEHPDRPCHDTGIILGDANLAACAGGDGFTVWSLDEADGGSLDHPAVLYSESIEGVTIGHSAAFTWDGEVLVFGHEPGGGGQAQCQESSPDVNKTLFFYDARSGEAVGTWMVERHQSEFENCTIHNYNVVPTDKGYVLVSGNYQMGIAVVDFTDPANAHEIAYADPEPLSETMPLITGGDWSSYWYNGNIYQSDIRRGLIVWKLSDPAVAGAKKFDHLNPQTQETTFGKSAAFGKRGGR
jgi:hypothetical protein